MQSFDDYLLGLSSRMKRWGFSEFHHQPQDIDTPLCLHKREFVATKFSIVDTFSVVMRAPLDCTPLNFETLSKRVFQFALDNKNRWPRGLGGGAVAYPVLVADTLSGQLRSFAESYCPKHWASIEFPVLVDLSSQSICHYASTPAWGAFYYEGLRNEARRLFWPE
jgi:hypothetical protein